MNFHLKYIILGAWLGYHIIYVAGAIYLRLDQRRVLFEYQADIIKYVRWQDWTSIVLDKKDCKYSGESWNKHVKESKKRHHQSTTKIERPKYE